MSTGNSVHDGHATLCPPYSALSTDGVTTSLDGVWKDDTPVAVEEQVYPHAPGLPADQTINCGCTHVLVSDDWDDLPRSFATIDAAQRADYRPAA